MFEEFEKIIVSYTISLQTLYDDYYQKIHQEINKEKRNVLFIEVDQKGMELRKECKKKFNKLLQEKLDMLLSGISLS